MASLFLRSVVRTAAVLMLCTFASNLFAQPPYHFTKIVETGAVGSNGQTIVLCNPNIPTTINNSGTVAFQVGNSGGFGLCMSGNGVASNWTGDGSAPVLIYPLDGHGQNGLGPGAVIASGEVAFVVPDPGTLTNHLYFGVGGQPTLVANGSFLIWFVAADNTGAVAVISEGPGGVPSSVLRYDTPLASPVVIDSDAQELYGPVRAINAGLEVAFAKEDPVTFQRTRVLKGSGGQLTIIGQAGNILNGMTLEMVGQYVAIRDDGFVAFQGQNLQQGTGIYLGNGSQTFVVVDTQGASPFQGVDNPALSHTGRIAFWGLLKAASCPGGVNACDGIYTGPDPVADKVIQTGDVIDGLTVVQVDNATPPSINDAGQIAIGLWLTDGVNNHYAVYRADPGAPTSTALQATPSSAVFGQTVSLTATVSSAAAVPTGSAQFLDGTASLGTVALSDSGVAQLSTSSLGIGTHSLKATYPGATGFRGSESATVAVTVNKANSSVAIVATPNPVKKRQPIQITVTVSAQAPGSGTPSGSVRLMNGKKQLGSAPLVNGSAAFQLTFGSPGDVTVAATYAGDSHFNGQASSNYVIHVSK
jgi:hypothetical protein